MASGSIKNIWLYPLWSFRDEFNQIWEATLPTGIERDIVKLLNFAYYGEDKRKTINFLDPLSLPNDSLRLFERLFQIKKKVCLN